MNNVQFLTMLLGIALCTYTIWLQFDDEDDE